MRFSLYVILLLSVIFSGLTRAAESTLFIQQTKIGNIFIGQEPISFKIQSPAKQVAWQVKDFWGNTILKGDLAIANGVGLLTIPLKVRGYFSIRISEGKENLETSFAVLTPFDIKTVKESPFGMNTHFAQGHPPEVMDLVAMAGIKTIRDELYWTSVERKKGEYAFMPTYWYMEYARNAGVRPLICLSYANPLYDDNNAPCTPEGYKAFANYGKAVASTYGDLLEGVEVWNEYNCGVQTRKTGNKPELYLPMLIETYKAVKSVQPKMKVVGVGMSCIIWSWLHQLLGMDALKYMDGLSVHPYRWDRWYETPETLDADMDKLHALIKKFNNTGRKIPVWSTEVSWPSIPECSISPEKQANYLVRTYAILWSKSVEKNYWYKFICEVDDGIESQFGIVRHWTDPRGKLTPKPAYVALAVMSRQLSGWNFVRRDKIDKGIWCLLFKKGTERKQILWAPRLATVTILADKPVTLTDIMGNEQILEPVKGELYLTLGENPVYLSGPVKNIISGAKITLSTNPKIATGEPIVINYVPGDMVGTLEIEGTDYPIDGKKEVKAISLPGVQTIGTRLVVYKLKIDGRIVGYGCFSVQIMNVLDMKVVDTKKPA